jgi:hypothetical protein
MSDIDSALAIRRLADVYCSAVDDGDPELMASLFAPGGQLVVYEPGSWPGAGEPLRRWDRDGFRKLIAVLAQSYVRWVHFLGNHWADIDGERATGQAYLLACHLRAAADGQAEEEVAVIRYRDSYVLTDDGWRFQERNACRQWTTVRPVASSQHEIDAVLHGRRGS